MGAVLLTARSRIRLRVPAILALIALVGITGGVVLAALAGARRTESAFPRLLEATAAADVWGGGQIEPLGLDVDAVAAMPGVERAGELLGFGLFLAPPDGEQEFDVSFFATAPTDGVVYDQMSRPMVLDGRLPDPARADEVLLNEAALEAGGLEVGDPLDALLFESEVLEAKLRELERTGREPTDADIDEVFDEKNLTVVGVGRFPWEIVPDENDRGDVAMVLTPAFASENAGRESYNLAHVDLEDPSEVGAFQAALQARHPDIGLDLHISRSRRDAVAAATSPYASALSVFALALGATAFLVIGQAVARQAVAGATQGRAQRAIGMTGRQRTLAALGETAVVAVAGGVLSAVVAVLLSGFFPIGPARLAEPDPGLHLDIATVGIGAVVIVALILARGAIAAHRATATANAASDEALEGAGIRLADRLAGAGLSLPATTGVCMALSPRSREGRRSLVTTVVGLTVAAAAITGSLTFGAGLDRLVSSPSDYGWQWDVLFDNYWEGDTDAMVDVLAHDSDVDGFTVGARGTVTMGDRSVPAYGFDPRQGDVLPAVSRGRAPEGPGEVVLGQQTLDALGVEVGGSVGAVAADGTRVDLLVVGRTVFPALSRGEANRLSEGAMLTFDGLERLSGLEPSFVLVDLAPGAELHEIEGRYEERTTVFGPQKPGDILSYEQVRALPLVLAGILAVLGLGVLGHALISSTSDRRRELAVLRALGLVRRQVNAAVRWHALTLASIALLVGIPLGLAAGRWAWRLFESDLGAGGEPVTPALALGALLVAAAVVTCLLAVWPARRAQSTPPAAVLRAG